MSPDILTWQRDSSLPRKKAWMISWNAIASGMVSLMPIVSGEGPREPKPNAAVLNSKLPTESARAMLDGELRPARIASERRDGGLGMAIDVGVWRESFVVDALVGAAAEMSPTSENMSLSSAYRLLALKMYEVCHKVISKGCYLITNVRERLLIHLVLFVIENVGLWSGAYGCAVVGVLAFDAIGLCWCCWNTWLRLIMSLMLAFSAICCDIDWDLFMWSWWSFCELLRSLNELIF